MTMSDMKDADCGDESTENYRLICSATECVTHIILAVKSSLQNVKKIK